MSDSDVRVLRLLADLEITPDDLDGIAATVHGNDPVLPTPYAIGELAAAAIGAAATAAALVWHDAHGAPQRVDVDVRLAAASLLSFYLQSYEPPAPLGDWNRSDVTGTFRTAADRWIHLHGGFEHLANGTTQLLRCDPGRDAIARAVRRCDAFALEDALAEAGLCGAVVRTADEWAHHPQGSAVAKQPLVGVQRVGTAPRTPLQPFERPLDGVRVLDFTRVLAGPVVGRTLAEHGADVLLVNAPHLENIAPFVTDTGHGKRSTVLDLGSETGRQRLEALLDTADVVVDGYRSGALSKVGVNATSLTERGVVYVDVNCYGHDGPWRDRRGWEQLAQAVSGLCAGDDPTAEPVLLPAAACDYTTGYLGALGAIVALRRRARDGGGYLVDASLCQTANWIRQSQARQAPSSASGLGDLRLSWTSTAKGTLRHLPPVAQLSTTPGRWDRPPAPIGAHEPIWLQRRQRRSQ